MANTPTTFEQKWPTVILAPIAVANHVVTVSDTAGLHTKAVISLSIAGQETVEFEIKRVLNDTQIQVGYSGKPINAIENPTQFDGGMLTMSEQQRNKFGSEVVLRAVYEEEPATALRNLLVNKYGAPIDTTTRLDGKTALAVDAQINVNVPPITVDIDALTPNTRPDPDNVLIAGSEDGTKTGIKRAARVDSALDLRVALSNGANKAEVDIAGKLAVKDVDAETALANILTLLTSGTIKVDDDQTQTILTNLLTLLTSGTIKVDDDQTQAILSNTYTLLSTGTLKVDDDQTQSVLSNILTQLQNGGLAVGTEDGTVGGVKHVFVNNLTQMILSSSDKQIAYTYSDVGPNKRLDKTEYASATFPGVTVRKAFTWADFGTKNERVTNISWSLV